MSRFPEDSGLLTLLGESLAANVDTKAEAIRHYERLTALDPKNDQAAVRLARLYIELGDLNAGQRLLEKVTSPNTGLCSGAVYLRPD